MEPSARVYSNSLWRVTCFVSVCLYDFGRLCELDDTRMITRTIIVLAVWHQARSKYATGINIRQTSFQHVQSSALLPYLP